VGICDGRVALVTGAGRGLGRSHALAFAEAGAKVVVNDVGAEIDGNGNETSVAQQVVDEIVAMGGEAVADTHDITSWEGSQAMIATAVDTFGTIDTLMCNAGNLRDRMLVNLTEDDWNSVIAVHLTGHFFALRHAGAYWRDRSKAGEPVDARVIFTTSGTGLFGNVGQMNYVAAKAGIAMMGRAAAVELSRYGVKVNVLGPVARTRMTGDPKHGRMARPEEGFDEYAPENVSPLVVWLGSAECDVTGETFEMFGGRLGIFDCWRRGPAVDLGRRWQPEEIGATVRTLVAEHEVVPVAGTPEYAAWDTSRTKPGA
jgi:NAD(P)-dependent dehydrogenase (short-subunit alcohol dehydrogenase family)